MAEQDWLGTPSPPLEPGAAFVEKSMLHGCRVCSSTALIRRSAVPEGGFRQEDFPPFDFAFWLRMAEQLGRRVRRRGRCAATGSTSRATRRRSSDVTATGYLQAEQTLREVHAVKRRHAATLPPGPRRTELERAADRALRRDIISRVRERTLPDRPFKATVRGLADAARREPALLREPTAWALLAGSVLGAARGRAAKGSCVGPRRPRRRSRRSPRRGSWPAR